VKNIQRSNSYEANDAFHVESRSPYLVWLIWVIWLPFIIPPLVNLLQSHPPSLRLLAILVEVALFLAIYLWATWQTAHRLVTPSMTTGHIQTSIWLIIAVLATLSFTIALSGQANQWLGPFIFTSGYAGGSLRTARATLAVVVLTLLLVILGGLVKLHWLDLLQGGVFVVAVGFIVMSVVRAIQTSWELRAAREEIAHLAVTAERLRIARDLHDLLGHNLSLIALKSELAGRLVHRAPDRAIIEIGDVEQVARTTLQEVREAVASYRQPTLLNELHGAQEILTAAGIVYRYEGNEQNKDILPTEVEAVLAWTIREGVTNVIRHSHAQQCTISLKQERDEASVEITDDGASVSSQSKDANSTHGIGNRGNGLCGLAERVEGLGGKFEVEPRVGKGFRLAVSVPLTHRIETHGTVPALPASHVHTTFPKHVGIDAEERRKER